MFLSISIQNSFQAKQKLVSLSKYKGPILKLTQKDKAEIAKLIEGKTLITFELDKIRERLKKNTNTITKEWRQLTIVESKLLGEIDIIDERIREIKINRLNIQKEKLNKKV